MIDVRGQRVSATDRLYLLESMPTLIVWGERDNTIPLAHGRRAHEAIPHSLFRTLPGAAHFPHLEDPDGARAGCCASSSPRPSPRGSTTPTGARCSRAARPARGASATPPS